MTVTDSAAAAPTVVAVSQGGADLHMHTTASDGTQSPTEMVALARQQGLVALAVTDHDTVDGLRAAGAAAAAAGLAFIPGVELSCEVQHGTEIHVLGYLCNFEHGPLSELLARMRAGRQSRAEAVVDRLNQLGIPVRLERVLEIGQGAVGRPHLAAALVELGFAKDLRAAFDQYLVRGRPAYIPRPKLGPEEAIAAIRGAGGVPIIAHPGLIGADRWIPRLIAAGAAGLEAFHSDHTPAQCAHYGQMARQGGWLITGGSDSHGGGGSRPVLPGQVRVNLAAVAGLHAEKERATGG